MAPASFLAWWTSARLQPCRGGRLLAAGPGLFAEHVQQSPARPDWGSMPRS